MPERDAATFWTSSRAWACQMDEMPIRCPFYDVLERFDIVSKIDIESVRRYTFSLIGKEDLREKCTRNRSKQRERILWQPVLNA